MQSKLKVKLLEYTPNPDKLVASAAKLCYSSTDIETLQENLTDNKIEKFISMLMDLGHQSPLEHISFTFAIEGISRIVEQQTTRHRLASYSIQSGRYVKRDNPDIVIPKNILNNSHTLDIFLNTFEQTIKAYNQIIAELLTISAVHYLRESNADFSDWIKGTIDNYAIAKFQELNKLEYGKAEKEAIESARYIYPQGMATKMIMTMNARQLLHFFNERCCTRSQEEIREMAFEMLTEVKKVSPLIFKNAGAKCVKNKLCPEGKMSCGLFPILKVGD